MRRALLALAACVLGGIPVAEAAVTLTVSAPSITFASQNVGTTSAASAVTVKNTGSTAGAVTVSLSGTGSADFKQSNTCGASLAAGASCTISVTFTPAAASSYSATLSVGATGATTKTVALSGTGTAAVTLKASASPTSLTFASTTVGASSAAQTVTVSNTGTGSITVSAVALGGSNASAFAQTNTCTAALAAGKTCAVSVTFKPTAAGSASAALSITTSASATALSVALSGTGAAAVTSYTLAPTSLSFLQVPVGSTSAAQVVTLTNTGTAPLTVTSATLAGTAAAQFVLTNSCTAAVAAKGTCTFSVSFKPSAAASASASVSVVAGGVTASVAATGTAVAASGVRPLPAVYTTGKAVAYSPFQAGGPNVGEVPTDAQILQDLALLQSAGYNLLRLYGADVNASNILRLIAANYPTMSVQLGIYLEGAPSSCVDTVNASEIATAISLATTYTQVVSVSVGNETSLANNLPVTCLLSYVQQVRTGVNQPITADDVASFYYGKAGNGEQPTTILPYLDFVSIHTYPILNPTAWDWQQLATPTGPSRATAMMNAALAFAQNEFNLTKAFAFTTTAGVKTTIGAALPIVIGETGWKAAWTNPNSAIELYTATPINEKAYLDLLTTWKAAAGAPLNFFFFEGFDEAWKGTDDGWGLWDATRTPRYALCGVVAGVTCQSPVYTGIGYYP